MKVQRGSALTRRLRALGAGAVAGALAVMMAVGGAGSAAAADAPATDLRIGTIQSLDSVNPFNQLNDIAYVISAIAYDQLLNYSTSDLSPDLDHSLASSYEVSDDGMTWTFHLHPDITWSDGVPFTSADVKWTYESARDNETNVMNTYVAGIESIDTPDDTTVVLHLSAPDVRMSSISVPILPKHVFESTPIDQLDKIDLPLPSVTTGPYVITKFDKTGTTILEANPKFRGEQPAVKRILETNYGNQDSLLRDLQGGALDVVAQGQLQWTKQLAGSDGANIQQWSGASAGFQEIAFNSCPPGGAGDCSGVGPDVNVKAVQDPAIRQALAYAIDKPTIAATVYAGVAQPAYGIISPYYATYFKDWSTDPDVGYAYNLDKARQVLADGGWDCSATPCTKDGAKAAFTLNVRTNDPEGQNAMRRVIASAGEIGIDITLSVVTEDALNNLIYAPGPDDTVAPDFDAFYWAWIGDPTPDFNFSVLQTGSAWTDSYYSNTTYDELTSKALGETDFAQRVDLLHQAEKIAMTDLPYIPIVYSVTYDLTRTDTWHGYQPSPAGDSGSPIGANWLQVTGLQPGPESAEAPPSSESSSAASDAGSSEAPAQSSGESDAGSAAATTASGSTSDSASAPASSGGVPTWLVVLLIAVVVVLIIIVIVVVRRGKGGGRQRDEDPDDEPFN